MSEQEMLSVYHELFDDAKREDIEHFNSHLDANVRWHEPKGSPTTQQTGQQGEYRSPKEVKKHINKFFNLFKLKDVRFKEEFVVEGNKVISFGSTELESKETHKTGNIDFACECTFKGDKINDFRMYRDTAIEQSLLRQ
ncbi:nuclear transport factor 2 family protein [Xanthovirga aplysinae]|uniref:nuclear transport factor 2 family protein n=1 Tax=Xanthovirga aplysinae TaxID=2529853 RepID=UPI0012BC6973|nr:nuclear transport factor 2 family protein [Xanthovirga aplysinae]MTI30376.1 hypothetical protein [Xanthovirga aplysinae]